MSTVRHRLETLHDNKHLIATHSTFPYLSPTTTDVTAKARPVRIKSLHRDSCVHMFTGNTATCNTAFFKPDDNQVQVQCEDNNVRSFSQDGLQNSDPRITVFRLTCSSPSAAMVRPLQLPLQPPLPPSLPHLRLLHLRPPRPHLQPAPRLPRLSS